MKITIKKGFVFTISEIGSDEIMALVGMIRGASLEERRLWFSVYEALTKTPFDKLERDESEQLEKFAGEVEKMRRAQKAYFRGRTQEALRLSIGHERNVDDMVYNILNRK